MQFLYLLAYHTVKSGIQFLYIGQVLTASKGQFNGAFKAVQDMSMGSWKVLENDDSPRKDCQFTDNVGMAKKNKREAEMG